MKDHKLIRMLMRHEGFSSKPYKCPAGYWTIGFGRNLETVGITEGEATHLLITDIENARSSLEKLEWFRPLNEARKAACINLCINLGFSGFLKFRKMIEALSRMDFEMAALELQDSKYSLQVPNRSLDLQKIIRTGILE